MGLLSRSIKIQGDPLSDPVDITPVAVTSDSVGSFPNPATYLTGFGGHVLVSKGGSGKLSAVELHKMGQTNVMGRYPFHLHLLRGEGVHSYLTDSSIWNSFYRCVSVHGTDRSEVSRNVAYDAIGHCYYLEDGSEQDNMFKFNLGAYIHAIAESPHAKGPYGTSEFTGQFLHDVPQTNTLLNPADVAAGPFYITNAFNTFVGNAASGGWAGYSFPGLSQPLDANRNKGMVPRKQRLLKFDGNTAHSTGYWWENAGGVYVGGGLGYKDGASDQLVYNGGRQIHSGFQRETEEKDVLTNIKVAMASTGVLHWGNQIEIAGANFADFRRAANLFSGYRTGSKMHGVHATCYTAGNGLGIVSVPMPWKSLEHGRLAATSVAFNWYDTGQSHVLEDITWAECDGPTVQSVWGILTHSDEYVPEFMQVSANIRYKPVPPLEKIISPSRYSTEYGVSASARMMNWLDADGTAVLTGVPTILGSAVGSGFWHLDDACTHNTAWEMWSCPINNKLARLPGSIYLNHNDAVAKTVGKKICGNGNWVGLTCPVIGWVNHFGYKAAQRMALTAHPKITGPLGGYSESRVIHRSPFSKMVPKNLDLRSVFHPAHNGLESSIKR